MAKLLGIDVGTSGCKVILINEEGQVLKQAGAEYPLSVPQPRWSEQNPEDWWVAVQKCMAEIGETPDAIGVTGQMHGAVFLDENDEVIRPAILWNDQRTIDEVAEMDAVVGAARVRAITCNPPLTGFQAPKLVWLRNHEPANFARVRSVLLPKDYIRFRLTGEKVTEVSDASGTGIFDVPNRTWSQEMISELGFQASWFPRSVESWEVTGKTSEGIPVVGGGGDQAAGAVGTGAVVPGVISVSLGTSGVVFTSLNEPRFDQGGATHTFCHANGQWHGMGVMLSCGGALRWYRDTFAPGTSYDVLMEEAASAPAGCLGATFMPYLTGERSPHNDPLARAAFAGITLGHSRAHFTRAVIEGVSFGLREGLDRLVSLGATADALRLTGGGAKSPFWRQVLADVFQRPCQTLQCDEGPAYGAAILAGVGAGIWADVPTACRAAVKVLNEVAPDSTNYDSGYLQYQGLYAATRDWNRSLGA